MGESDKIPEKPKDGGLSPEEHGRINLPAHVYEGGIDARNLEIDRLRLEYAHDPLAQYQLDRYDTRSVYKENIGKFIDALKTRDGIRYEEMRGWLAEYFREKGIEGEKFPPWEEFDK